MMRDLCAFALATLAIASGAFAQSADNVLLVVNESSGDSVRIADHYARTRGVPSAQVLPVRVDAAADEVERGVFEAQVQAPIVEWIRRNSAHDRILYIVLTKGIPLRVRGTPGRGGTVASVDSELALLYRRLAGTEATLSGPVANPYYLADSPVAKARTFSHEVADIYLVTRLDGFTADDVLKAIDKAAAPVREGRILLDQKAALDEAGGNAWLKATADWMQANGFGDRAVLETTSRVLTGEQGVLGYYGWGSNDPAVTTRTFDLTFVPGAIAGMFVSTDARTFKLPPAGWTTGPWTDRTKLFAGSPQSLTGDMIHAGVTGVAGHVAEPYLDATIRPDILFPAYLSGFNLAESFYLAMPYVSWQTVVVGDPLCSPFTRTRLAASDIDKGMDPATELPATFSARRLKAAMAQGTTLEAARLLLRAEARTGKGDKPGAVKALEEAATLEPKLTAVHVLLAQSYEEAKEYDKAIDRYRKVLALTPNDTVALNNLAYALSVRKGLPSEALGFAERAYALTRGNATVADTLAWVQHLLGRDRDAAPLLAAAVKGLPENAEVRLHAAVVYAQIGMLEPASKELAEAIRLSPALEASDEAKAVRAKTGKK
jgi:uncharacterized protein (TIGR03790 family)